jgi:nucleotide-binding universal stress UspA family protein
MTGPVVCGVDFSDDSKRALRWADFLAQRLGQPLVIVHAVETLLANAAHLEYGADALQTTLQPELDAFIAAALGDTSRSRTEIATGEPAGVLNGTALAAGAALIVVGTQGLGQAGRLWFGSTTTRLLREAATPVLAVPRGAAARSETELRIAEIIVGTDFGDAARAAILAAEDLGRLFDVPVTGLHAVPDLSAPAGWSALVAQVVEHARREARAKLEASVPAQWTNDVRSGDAAQVLVDAASGRDALIVVGLGGSSAGQRPGTTAYRVLRDADAPVLAVPPR